MTQLAEPKTLSEERLSALDRYWRAANYLSVGQIYLHTNPLLRTALKPEHIKKRLLGHFGTSPGLNLIYAHLNRLIQDTDVNVLYITGPGHGGPALRANVYLEGAMTETYPDISLDEKGIEILMREFSWPGGVPSHVSPHVPGSMHEGGELGYSLAHAFGAVYDNPDLIAACVVGDGEAESGPLAASWHSVRFLNPVRDGAVLPILHLNGYKISGPTVFGRMDEGQLVQFFEGCGYKPCIVEGDEPMRVHRELWSALDWAHGEIKAIHDSARQTEITLPAKWPMIILKTPKGWTGPKIVDGQQVEGTFRSHQVPVADVIDNPQHLRILDEWLRSYRPEELFDQSGTVVPDVLQIVPRKEKHMGRNPHTNGGNLLQDLTLPPFESYAVEVKTPGSVLGEASQELGKWFAEVMKENSDTFRIFCPDETKSNRLTTLFDVTERMYLGKVLDSDEALGSKGRVMEVLSEHLCQGWLEGYLLTGRHGFFPCYEAFAPIVDSMLNQHSKWLKACLEIPWRKPIASLNYLLTSHTWRQDHNGFSHQGPGFIDSVMQKKASVARIYLPPDANTLLSMGDHCLRSRDYVNLIICGKQPMPQWLTMEQAKAHCKQGSSIWEWASNAKDRPDVVLASAGDVPTLEMMAATSLLRKGLPDLKVQVVNIVDLFSLVDPTVHSHGMKDETFYKLFPQGIPVIFAFHGRPTVIHEQTYRRDRAGRFHVRGYIEEGTTTTPFDMVVLNKMSRYHLAMDAAEHSGREDVGPFIERCEKELQRHTPYIREHGEDLPEVRNWKWEG